MQVGIYNEPSGTMGGSEYLVSVIADALATQHDVEIVHHNPTLTLDQLRSLSGLSLGRVTLRHVTRDEAPDPRLPRGFRHFPERYRTQKAWHAALSRPYDLFINSTHGIPPFCHARRGVLLTLFPVHSRRRLWPWVEPGHPAALRRAHNLFFDWMWRRRFRSYQQRFSISRYTREWTKAWWLVDTDVLYPPVDTRFDGTSAKANLILSVGRFSTFSHSKRQLETMRTFCDLCRTLPGGWQYYSVGGLLDNPADREYFERVSRVAAECGARVLPNVARGTLRDLLARAKVFWHAAGYDAAPDAGPFEAEHFGIATVEAMAAGAVPVVCDHGGQSEIVEHGRSGFLWSTLDELRAFTRRLIDDDSLRTTMAAAAQARAAAFSRERFVTAVEQIVG
jgi:glycosyltransferase involved in cell wall biosynthesis